MRRSNNKMWLGINGLVGLGLLAPLMACGTDPAKDRLSGQKVSFLQDQREGEDVCAQLGLPAGCDLCAELGFYGDGICDNALIQHGLCAGPDPDCAAAESICDDGIDDDGDGLVDCADLDCDYTPVCWPSAACGDGVVDAGEQCDDGNGVDGDGCSATCLLEEAGEQDCSDRMDNDGDGLVDCADPDCAIAPACTAVCGNGVVEAGEECDDGNGTDGDGCSATCLLEGAGEQDCSDRMDNDGDGLVDCADPDCASAPACTAVCGDGLVAGLEECDDGNLTSGDGCSAYCTIEVGVEICDDGLDNDGDGLVDCVDSDCWYDPACATGICGNGVVEAGEQCDDGNTANGDGCSVTCMLEEHVLSCDDGIDNDRDGLVDCADPDCAQDPACP